LGWAWRSYRDESKIQLSRPIDITDLNRESRQAERVNVWIYWMNGTPPSRPGEDSTADDEAALAGNESATAADVATERGVEMFRVTLTTSPTDGISAVLSALTEVDAELTVDDVCVDGEGSVEISVDDLTEKQRRTIVRAVELGYYETPRQATLSDLTAEFNISKSAISQRLNKAEAKILRRVVRSLDLQEGIDDKSRNE